MNVVAVSGIGGGVGSTTVAAHLSAALVAQSRRCLAFDFSPANTLRLHFGMDWNDHRGLAPQLLATSPWHEAAYRAATGVDFLPFGEDSDDTAAGRLADFLTDQPQWFSNRLELLDEPQEAFAICDTSVHARALRRQAFRAAQLVLIVLMPDALSVGVAAASKRRAVEYGASDVVFVLNGFDSTRQLHQDIVSLLRAQLSPALAPVLLHRDEHLCEALANKQTVFDYAPTSQACGDFQVLATWVVARLMRLTKAS